MIDHDMIEKAIFLVGGGATLAFALTIISLPVRVWGSLIGRWRDYNRRVRHEEDQRTLEMMMAQTRAQINQAQPTQHNPFPKKGSVVRYHKMASNNAQLFSRTPVDGMTAILEEDAKPSTNSFTNGPWYAKMKGGNFCVAADVEVIHYA